MLRSMDNMRGVYFPKGMGMVALEGSFIQKKGEIGCLYLMDVSL